MLQTIAVGKRRIIHIKKHPLFKKIRKDNFLKLDDSAIRLRQDFNLLLLQPKLATDARFLRKVAINIKQLHYDAIAAKKDKVLKQKATQISHFLSTPLGAPFVARFTLLEAADSYGEQDVDQCDLKELLEDFAKYGTRFRAQILGAFFH